MAQGGAEGGRKTGVACHSAGSGRVTPQRETKDSLRDLLSYPTRAIRLIVAFAPGGSVDVVARYVGQKLTESIGQTAVIDNRPGAGGNVSAEIAARAAPDGYTLYMTSAARVVNASLYRRIPYDPVRDSRL